MATATRTEIAEKLIQLKQHSLEYDVQRSRMTYTHGKEVDKAYQLMVEAERQYLALSDWFVEQGIPVFWDCEAQKYIALPSIHTPNTK